ncbi:MAG: hypothetical protein NZM25_06065 [Leptospiraceae bacterium]|nr:hypothetical protein [Leptospiraceae bacterium]MDW8306659.1 hypothetical protein [Leptospiraceae bacterium]
MSLFLQKILPWLFVFLLACQKRTGELAFALVDESTMSPLEAYNFVPRRFYKSLAKGIFPDNKKLWFVYRPPLELTLYGKPIFIFALQKKSLGYLDIDLRRKTVDPQDGVIRDFYENLQEGDYRLRITTPEEVLLEYDFEIISMRDQDIVNYEEEVIPDSQEGLEVDDIRSLSY